MLHKFVAFDSAFLLNVRIIFLLSAFVHLTVTALVTLSIDMTVDEDPRVRAYYFVKWKLLTCWFNLITLCYLSLTLYYNWRTKQGDGDSALTRVKYISDVMMTSLIFPVTVFSDIMFWSMFLTDPALLGPPRIFEYLPYWAQHSLHTVSLFVVIFDLILTPRKRPKSSKSRVAMLVAFATIYTGMVYNNSTRGEFVYAVCERMNSNHFIGILIFTIVTMLALFELQWVIIQFIWGTHKNTSIRKKD